MVITSLNNVIYHYFSNLRTTKEEDPNEIHKAACIHNIKINSFISTINNKQLSKGNLSKYNHLCLCFSSSVKNPK